MIVHCDPVLYSIKKPRTSYVLKLQDQRKSNDKNCKKCKFNTLQYLVTTHWRHPYTNLISATCPNPRRLEFLNHRIFELQLKFRDVFWQGNCVLIFPRNFII